MEYVTIDDILKLSNFRGKIMGEPKLNGPEKAKIVYDAYEDWSTNNLSPYEVEDEYGVNKSAVRVWVKGAIPIFIKNIRSLEKRGLLPLNDESPLGLITFFWLETLLTGHLQKRGCESYNLFVNDNKNYFRNKKDLLENLGIKINPDKTKGGNYFSVTSIKPYKDPIISGLHRLLVATGLPTGKNYDFIDLKIPEFIDGLTLIYYVFKLKGYFRERYGHISEAKADLWLTNEENAEHNLNVFLKRMNGVGFDFYGNIIKDKRYNGDRYELTGIMPRITLSKVNQVKRLQKFVNTFEPKII